MDTKLDIFDPFRAEGIAVGQVKFGVDTVIGKLTERFTPPADLLARIRATTDLTTLRDWIFLAAQADSLDAFRRDAGL
jgi:hypothetical protein